jgi:putative transcriptional regulator
MAFTIQNKIVILRQERQLLQEDVAKAVEVSRQTMSALEKGSYVPSLLLAMSIAEYFGVRIEELFTLEEIKI